MTMTTSAPSNSELDYRDDRDIALKYVDNFVRRVKLHVDALVKMEHAQAVLEGRSPSVDISREGIKALIATAAVAQAGGQTLEIG